ncbi:peptidylprolyl isomerase [Terasakiella sp. A23]|uniref:peptidylprolyl isomerase n=1 Tax=Terasakiella sp. FCG-A23 TaxID=3080561 RepID=UPI0029558278|nr:peptidylprolyl isomerase [Terasakiella sp. A23]MDV7340150.1 peptidylprolyl isomerase [Terasakiella sp. A23]
MKRLLVSLFILVGLSLSAQAEDYDKENTLFLDLKNGRVVIKMRPDIAPRHVERIKKLTREGFYNGLKFHRVIPSFMAQTGDPLGTGMGGSKYPDLPAEFSNELHKAGTVSMARSTSPNSANSQFFIMFKKNASLDGQYTVWGHVVDGMKYVNRIRRGSKYNDGKVKNPDTIIKMQVAADVQ